MRVSFESIVRVAALALVVVHGQELSFIGDNLSELSYGLCEGDCDIDTDCQVSCKLILLRSIGCILEYTHKKHFVTSFVVVAPYLYLVRTNLFSKIEQRNCTRMFGSWNRRH